VRSLPDDFDPGALVAALAEGWDFDVENAAYAAVGGGSYHWFVTDVTGRRGFVTVDDLDQKPWLGDTRDKVFDGLARAFNTAVALRESGLGFVIAPIPTNHAETVRRVGPRYVVALFPFVDGQAGVFGQYNETERTAILRMLADLHAATWTVSSVANRMGLDIPGRQSLESALDDVNQPWSAGPLSEGARQALARHASDVAEMLALADRLAADVARSRGNWVVTHGEPHAGNIMRTRSGYVLIDWDTVALGPPERDLWMLAGDDAVEMTIDSSATGHQLDPAALHYFRLRWDLADIASFIDLLRSPHPHNEDSVRAFDNLRSGLLTRDRIATMFG
jgi:spectinomycin phosphotransferase